MGEMIDRGLQRVLLNQLSDAYPEQLEYRVNREDTTERANGVNLTYLMEQGLVVGTAGYRYLGDQAKTYSVRITAKGLDFLADDGGLGAILGVVTIKIHDDTIRKLIIQRIDGDPDASDEDRKEARGAIAKMSDKALSTIVEELTKTGLENIHKVVPWVLAITPTALRAAGLA